MIFSPRPGDHVEVINLHARYYSVVVGHLTLQWSTG